MKTRFNSTQRYNSWITSGIKVSCHKKIIVSVSCRESNDTNLRLWHKVMIPISGYGTKDIVRY